MIDDQVRRYAAAIARLIVLGEEIAPEKLTSSEAIRVLARAHVELRDQVNVLYDLVDTVDDADPVRAALDKAGLWPGRPRAAGPRIVLDPARVAALTTDQLVKLYCSVMRDVEDVFIKYETYVVRVWDGMDGCWTDCTGEVDREAALRYWAEKTDGGAHHIAYDEIDYYRIFPGDSRMLWDGSEGREMHR